MQEHNDRYRVHERIGRGGMAEVWRGARRLAPGTWQTVAIKQMYGLLDHEPLALAQLEREAHICMALRHENLVSVFDLDMVGGRPCLIMEYVDGITLRDLMNDRAVSPAMLRAILKDVLTGLDHAHAHGVLHRDISPRNIMVTRNGVAKVMDFGLAKHLCASSNHSGFAGTLAYASREALECQTRTRGSDIYSVGAVFYEALTHAPPYGRGDRLDMVRAMEHGPRPCLPDDTPDDLRAFIEFALGPTETRTDAAVDEAIARLHASLGPVMSRDELAESIAAMLDRGTHAEASLEVAPEHADTLDMLEHTQEAKFKPEEWATRLAAEAEAKSIQPGSREPSSTRQTETARRSAADRARTWLGVLAVAAVAVMASIPLLEFSDRALQERAPEPAPQPTMTSELPNPAHTVMPIDHAVPRRDIGPHPIARTHEEPAPALPTESSPPVKRAPRGKTRQTVRPSEPTPVMSSPPAEPRPHVAGFALRRLAKRPPDMEFTPPPGND